MLLKNTHILECHGFTRLDGNISIVLELSEDGPLDKVIYTAGKHDIGSHKIWNDIFIQAN